MKPPRFLLRERLVRELLLEFRPRRVLEIGYGRGELLVTMARLGFGGVGYDRSESAFEHATRRLEQEGVGTFRLVREPPRGERFDAVLFFEVIGYVPEPARWLEGLHDLLTEDGVVIFSFTNLRHAGVAERVTGDMRCFTAEQMRKILAEAGFEATRIWNYGFPLANALRWIRELSYLWHARRGARLAQGRRARIDASGFALDGPFARACYRLFDGVALAPFAVLQRAFRGTDLGTGYVAVAVAAGRGG